MRSPLSLSLLLLVSISTRTALAQVTAPSQGGEVGLVLATATTMELTFGTTGNGQGRVVAMAPTVGGMPVPLSITNNTFYTANASYGQGSPLGQGYIVYNGPNHSTTITDLKPNTYYYITNSEYNTDGSSVAYNTNGSSIAASTRAALPTAVTPLPVELISFTGTVDTRSLATLRWKTATEQRTAYFALERSADGTTFTEVGQVVAAGTSNQPLTYEYFDKQPLQATTYYRLRQVDQDGRIQYSQVLTLSPSPAASLVQSIDVYPNPSEGRTIHILLQGHGGELFKLHLTDALGRTVMTQAVTALESYHLTSLALPPTIATGSYILILAGNNGPIQKRIIVSN